MQGWANSGPLRVFLWPAKTVGEIRLEPRFSMEERKINAAECVKRLKKQETLFTEKV
jgi:hypothetical protein